MQPITACWLLQKSMPCLCSTAPTTHRYGLPNLLHTLKQTIIDDLIADQTCIIVAHALQRHDVSLTANKSKSSTSLH